MNLRIVHPARLQNLRIGEKWIYADGDLHVYQSIEEKYLGVSERLISAQDFQERAIALRGTFVEWVDCYLKGRCQRKWLATPFQKNPFESNLFLHFVWIDVICEVVGKGLSPIVVVTADLGLAKSLQNLARTMRIESPIIGKEYFLIGSLCRTAWAIAKYSYEAVNMLWRIILSDFILGKDYLKRTAGVELLLDTYLHEGDITSGGEYPGRYFPGLLQYYLEHGYRTAIYPYLYKVSPVRLITLYRQIRESRYIFALPESFLKIQDVFMALVESARMVLATEDAMFRGLNVSPLVAGQQTKFALGGFIPLLLVKVPERMGEAGVKPRWVIDWFENQPVDKALCIGFGKCQPQCQVIGVAQYTTCGNDFFIFRSNGEISAGVVPKENWFCGSELKNVAGLYGAINNYRIVPALRYSYLYQNTPVVEKGDTLLVLLTHSAEESMGILDCVTPLCREKGMVITRFVIKTHPDMNLTLFRHKAEQRFPSLSMNTVEWSVSKLSELLPAARVVVTSGSSSAVEAVCRGIPVVLVGRHAGLNFNPLEEIDAKIWAIAYTPDEIKTAITEQFCEERLPIPERLAIAENTRNALFMKMGDVEMRRFLPTELKTCILQ